MYYHGNYVDEKVHCFKLSSVYETKIQKQTCKWWHEKTEFFW